MYRTVVLFLLLSLMNGSRTERQYLSGTGEDNTVEWEFRCSGGANSGKWMTIPVPSCWELQGFGEYRYGLDSDIADEQGLYKYSFNLPGQWRGKEIFIVFEGVMTDALVKINGIQAGPVHKGAFYRFKYDITDLLKYGEPNLLEVTVDKESADGSVNRAERRADYWVFGGIFRPVYLEAQPQTFTERVAIDAGHDGRFTMKAYVAGEVAEGLKARAVIVDDKGRKIGNIKGIADKDGSFVFTKEFRNVRTWTPETPFLYKAVVKLSSGHEFEQKFGFRTVELREHDGFYLNGRKLRFKGVCRHTFWPESGRTSSRRLALEDVSLMKDMNMNAVRMSHYPPDQFFLDICDSVGLMVIDELAGWQKAYDADLACGFARDMVCRDQNHPSIVLWSNGNEGGFPEASRSEYARWDIQKRTFIEPWSKINGTNTKHYPTYAKAKEALETEDLVYFPTENMHGLHDGGHGAGLSDIWNLMLSSPRSAGHFLWVFADEGVVRHDLKDSIDCCGNWAPDGILGPHHEKEGSYFTIKEIWSPVQVEKPDFDSFDGSLAVTNCYDFIGLEGCRLDWSLSSLSFDGKFSTGSIDGSVPVPDIACGCREKVRLGLPSDWKDYDILGVDALDPSGHLICSWAWPLTDAARMAGKITGANGRGEGVSSSSLDLRFVTDGPLNKLTSLECTEAPGGWTKVEYSYVLDGECTYAGIGMTWPEQSVTGAELVSRGPYHVWNNRHEGVTFGLYKKEYNNSLAGERWDFPEFKGFYSDFHAVRLLGKDGGDLTIVSEDDGRYLQLFKYSVSEKHAAQGSSPRFPDADLAVLNCIPAIGTKFILPEDMGPSGKPHRFDGTTVRGTFYVR